MRNLSQRYHRSKGVHPYRPLGKLAATCHREESASHHFAPNHGDPCRKWIKLEALPLGERGREALSLRWQNITTITHPATTKEETKEGEGEADEQSKSMRNTRQHKDYTQHRAFHHNASYDRDVKGVLKRQKTKQIKRTSQNSKKPQIQNTLTKNLQKQKGLKIID